MELAVVFSKKVVNTWLSRPPHPLTLSPHPLTPSSLQGNRGTRWIKNNGMWRISQITLEYHKYNLSFLWITWHKTNLPFKDICTWTHNCFYKHLEWALKWESKTSSTKNSVRCPLWTEKSAMNMKQCPPLNYMLCNQNLLANEDGIGMDKHDNCLVWLWCWGEVW